MPGNILLLDPIATNRILMRVRLTAGYFNVTPCAAASEALHLVTQQDFSAVLCAPELPDMALPQFCEALQDQPKPLPLVAFQQNAGSRDLLAALEAGAIDLIDTSEPDALIYARLRALVRMERTHELPAGLPSPEPPPDNSPHKTDETGFKEPAATFRPLTAHPAGTRIALMHFSPKAADRWQAWLRPELNVSCLSIDVLHQQAFLNAPPDVLILGCPAQDASALAPLLANLRATALLRDMQILVIAARNCPAEVAQCYDLGAEAVARYGVTPAEVRLRALHLSRRKSWIDRQRKILNAALDAAVRDPLTGLHNRRFVQGSLPELAKQPYAAVLADVDHFKAVNDQFGHDAGDQVLQQIAQRLQALGAPGDILARIGGEEFLILRPCPTARIAEAWAKALCAGFAAYPFTLADRRRLSLTLSLGLVHVASPCPDVTMAQLLRQADQALYRAKSLGRNQVRVRRFAA